MAKREDSEERAFFEGLYTQYSKLMYNIAIKYTGGKQNAEDIVQEAFVKLYPKFSLLQQFNCCTLRAYLVSTIRNTAITHSTRNRQKSEREIPLEDADPSEFEETSAEACFFREEDAAVWRRILDELKEEERVLLQAKYFMQLSDREIARMLNVKPASVRMMLTRVRRKVLNKMSKEDLQWINIAKNW